MRGLIHAGGAGGSGNATVPPDAPIQPPQAFVDYGPALMLAMTGAQPGRMSALRPAFTHLSLNDFFRFVYGDPISTLTGYLSLLGFTLNLSESSLPTEDVDGLLSDVFETWSNNGNTSNPGYLYLYGPDMGVPTGGSGTESDPSTNPDLTGLIAAGWYGDYKDPDGNHIYF